MIKSEKYHGFTQITAFFALLVPFCMYLLDKVQLNRILSTEFHRNMNTQRMMISDGGKIEIDQFTFKVKL